MRMFQILIIIAVFLVTIAGCGGQSSTPTGSKPSAEGMTALPSGLQYRVLTAGSGLTPSPTSRVEVHYRGQFADGNEFDSSYSRGKPVVFPVNGVIKGWTEALQLMKEGSKWQLCIPSELAYGKSGMPPVIPPDTTLYFDVELLKVH